MGRCTNSSCAERYSALAADCHVITESCAQQIGAELPRLYCAAQAGEKMLNCGGENSESPLAMPPLGILEFRDSSGGDGWALRGPFQPSDGSSLGSNASPRGGLLRSGQPRSARLRALHCPVP